MKNLINKIVCSLVIGACFISPVSISASELSSSLGLNAENIESRGFCSGAFCYYATVKVRDTYNTFEPTMYYSEYNRDRGAFFEGMLELDSVVKTSSGYEATYSGEMRIMV